MEDAIHKSGPVARWRWSRYVAPKEHVDTPPVEAKPSQAGIALRRVLEILNEFPQALAAVHRGLDELAAEAPS